MRRQALIHGRGPAKEFGEDYNVYYHEILAPAMARVLDVAPSVDALEAAALGTYNSESALARRLAAAGADIVAVSKRLIQDPWPTRQENGYAILGLAVRLNREGAATKPLSTAQVEDAAKELLAGAQSSDAGMRRAAVRALADGGDARAIPLLMHMAETDSDVAPRGTRLDFSVRGEARRAAAAIRARGRR